MSLRPSSLARDIPDKDRFATRMSRLALKVNVSEASALATAVMPPP